MNKLRNYITLSQKSFKALAIFTLLACGPGMADYDEFMSFFMPESSNAKLSDRRYSYSSQFFYDESNEYSGGYTNQDTTDHDKILNVSAWSKYVAGKVNKKAITESIYGNSIALQAYLNKIQKNEAADYLTFVKTIDKAFSTQTVDYFTETKVDTLALVDLFTQVKTVLPTIKDEFVKERYGFQAIKLAMLNQQPQEAVELYDKYVQSIKKKSYIAEWALSRKAGAEIALGDSVQAYYDFAQVFDRCPSRRYQADLSIRSRGMGFQKDALKYAKNNHEKAAIYAFGAIKPNSDGLAALEKMVELDPNNPLIELVMSREINKNENLFYHQNNYWTMEQNEEQAKANHEKAIPYWEKLKEFAATCSKNTNLPKTGFWLAALSYIEYTERNFEQSSAYLAEAKLIADNNDGLSKQLKIQELLLLANQSPIITPALEAQLVPVLATFAKPDNFRMSNALTEASKQLVARYYGKKLIEKEEKQGWLSSCTNKKTEEKKVDIPFAKAKAYLLATLASYQVNSSLEYGGFMSQVDMYAIEDTTTSKTIEQVIAYKHTSSKTPYDSLLQKITGFSDDHLYVLLGRRALAEHDYAKAALAFEKVNPSEWKKEPWKTYFDEDPFYLAINGKDKRNTYTPLTYAQKMAEAAQKLANNPNDAEAAYLLGCGAYNISYMGNSWVLSKRQWGSGEVNSYEQKDFNTDYYLATKAKSYFEIALKSTDTELAAKACFGGAKCELSAFFVHAQSQGSNEDYETYQARINKDKERDFVHYFTLLKDKYARTKYQKEVLRECADYNLFAKKMK